MEIRKKRLTVLLFLIIIIPTTILLFLKVNSLNNETNTLDSNNNANEDSIDINIDELMNVPYVSENISLIAVGDFLLDRNIGNRMKETNDYHFPIENTKDILRSGDLTFCNIECPICEGAKIGITQVTFRADPETVEALTYGGFDVISLANNHTMDFGEDCLIKTFDYINEAYIEYVGAGKNIQEARTPLIKEIKDTTIAFLAYNDSDVVPSYYFASENSAGTNEMDISRLQEDIGKIKNGEYGDVDLIIVSMHSGTEFTPIPNSRQTSFARAAIDAGAEIVLGHHPHAVQHIEQYNGKYIVYSMGNFVLDQMRWENCTKELLLNLSISKDKVTEVEVIPLRMKKFCETNVAFGAEKADILNIINFDTETKPYISCEDGIYSEKQRDILINLDSNTNENETTENTIEIRNEQKIWNIDEERQLNVVNVNNRIYLIENNEIIYRFRNDWIITDFATGDVNDNGSEELAVSFWRVGDNGQKFGDLEGSRFNKRGNHIFIFSFENNQLNKLYSSSTISLPIVDLKISDLDQDGKEELITLNGKYEDYDNNNLKGNKIYIWEWNNETFSNKFESSEMEIETMWISRNMVYLETT